MTSSTGSPNATTTTDWVPRPARSTKGGQTGPGRNRCARTPPPAQPGDTSPELTPWTNRFLARDDALTEPVWRTSQYTHRGARPSRLYDFTVFVGLYRSASWPGIADAICHGMPDEATEPVPLSMQYVITAITCNENANPPAIHNIPHTPWVT
ncbi:hypothetical protein ONR57_12900 [Hoyosella sp. YIM 151337]|uniref:hypothetical protein n=1 Tax=Hoyosella sp. YIM 151337 TaxID=2992742 RepID=UPI0022369064|nr:hypothetical protein [Hoyosella sp. YIM 151337]MCW4354198.1 hypothetical protein [Hoyosella sp. YIM 151337]